MNIKTAKESYTERVQLVNIGDLNGSGRLFGGNLLSWIDMTAGIAARRHCGCDITTAAIDNLNFYKPAMAGDLVLLAAVVTYTGRTSMEVRVRSYVEKKNGERSLINEAFVIMVALDENGLPCQVPTLIPETKEEKEEYERAKLRKEMRKKIQSQGN